MNGIRHGLKTFSLSKQWGNFDVNNSLFFRCRLRNSKAARYQLFLSMVSWVFKIYKCFSVTTFTERLRTGSAPIPAAWQGPNSGSTNDRPVSRSRDPTQPIRAQCVGSADQWEEGVTGSRVGDGGAGKMLTADRHWGLTLSQPSVASEKMGYWILKQLIG